MKDKKVISVMLDPSNIKPLSNLKAGSCLGNYSEQAKECSICDINRECANVTARRMALRKSVQNDDTGQQKTAVEEFVSILASALFIFKDQKNEVARRIVFKREESDDEPALTIIIPDVGEQMMIKLPTWSDGKCINKVSSFMDSTVVASHVLAILANEDI